MTISTVTSRAIVACALITCGGPAVAQQAYPNRNIRIIVPFPTGGSVDPMARMVAQQLNEKWGQPVIVENRPGGNTIIGTDVVAKASPDGYTILLASLTFATSPGLLPHLPYEPAKDFAPVATIARSGYVLVINPSVPSNTLREFIALAKSKPGQLNYASSAIGGSLHLAAELFNIMAGIKMQHVPYKGSSQLIPDLISGQVHLSFQTPIGTIPFIASGRLKALGITSASRSSALPKVPTFAEGGLPKYEMAGWYGIVAPAGTPREIVRKLSDEIAGILTLPATRKELSDQGQEPFTSTPEQFAAMIKADIDKYAKVIKAADIRFEQ